jgi:putative restriction endonuclease
VWRYRFMKLPDQLDQESDQQSGIESSEVSSEASRRGTTVLRIVRDTKQARRIKELYDYRRQMCGIRLEGLAGPYAEAAHIRPLGTPHNGPDTPDNSLCLCPNHHVLFDHGGITIDEDLSLLGIEGRLAVHPRYSISEEHLCHRREHYRVEAWAQPHGAARCPVNLRALMARDGAVQRLSGLPVALPLSSCEGV